MNDWSVHGDAAGIFSKLFVADLACGANIQYE